VPRVRTGQRRRATDLDDLPRYFGCVGALHIGANTNFLKLTAASGRRTRISLPRARTSSRSLRFAWLAGLLVLVTCSAPSSQDRHAGGMFAPAPGSDGAGGGSGM